jgi:hypothetical protein
LSAATIFEPRFELARRVSGTLEVTLYWNSFDDSTSVELWQRTSAEAFAFAVPRERALDAFYHPFAHLPTASGDSRPELEGGSR